MKYLNLLLFCMFFSVQVNYSRGNTAKTAENFAQKADTLFKIFRYDSAALYYSKAADLYEKQEDWLYCVKNYRLTSNALIKAAKYDTAYYYTQKALTIAEIQFHENNKEEMFEKTDVLINMADVYEKKGKYEEELKFCKKALELTIKTDSLASLRIASAWDKTGVAYLNLGKYSDAIQYCDSAFNIRVKLLKAEHIDLAESNLNMGDIYYEKGEFDKALEYFQKALKINIANFGDQHPDIAKSYENIGTIYWEKGEYDKSLEYFQKALKINILTLGEENPAVASLYLRLGKVLRIRGEYDRSLVYYEKALKIYIKIMGERNANVAACFNSIGVAYDYKGEFDKALDYYKKALKICIVIYGEQHPYVASLYNNIGIIYGEKEGYDKALEYMQKAHRILINALGECNMAIAGDFNNIGAMYNKKGEYDTALEYMQKALNIRIKIMGELHNSVASSYNNIGSVFKDKREYNNALEYFQKANKILIETFGEQHPDVAHDYENIGKVYEDKGEYDKALEYYQKALLSNSPGFKDTSIYTNPGLKNILDKELFLTTLISKANTLYQLSRHKTKPIPDLEASLSTYELASQLINVMRNEYTNENTRLLLSDRTKNHFAEAAHVALEYGKTDTLKKSFEKIFEFLEKGKSASLAVRFNEFNAKHFAGIPDSLIEAEKECTSIINFYATEIVKEKYKKGGYDTAKVTLFENQHFSYSRRLDSLISYFETTYPDYYKFKYDNNIVTIQNIQQTIDKNTAVIDYLIGDTSIFIAFLTDSIYKIEEVAIDSSFKTSVINYYNDIKTAETEGFVINSNRIYEKLIKPIERYIAHKEHLIIIPDDYLYYIPFETLVENGQTKIENEDYSKLNYLIKSHSITYHHSATLWYNSKKRETELVAKQKVNFIGFAPVFSKETNNGLILSSNINAIDTTGNNLAYRSVSSDLKMFNPLPHSKDEVASIVRLFEKQKKEAKAYVYTEANESNFKNDIRNYRFIHVASHGFSNDKEPDLSGLVFSQPTDTACREDGILYVGETYNLRLNADLIVLSSCESGLGKLVKGEGLQALSRGFLYAGAQNVIFSLWNAVDKTTKDMMVQFYSDVLNGNTYAESLRQVKLNLINNPGAALPYFWSGFILVGR